MTASNLLDLIGEADGSYVWDVQQTRIGSAAPAARRSPGKPLLIAALVALMLLLVGCTVAYTSGWFTDFFTKHSGKPLSRDQVQFIQNHEQVLTQKSTQKGWTVELRSLMTDGTTGYIILGVTAPEGVSLQPEPFEMELLGTVPSRYVYFENNINKDMPPPIQYPEGVQYDGCVRDWAEDGDGLDNTQNYVIRLVTDPSNSSIDPFGPEAVYTITIQNFLLQQLYPEEIRAYLPQSGYLRYGYWIPDDTDRVFHRQTLVEGLWQFEICFDSIPAVQESLELISEPVTVRALTWGINPENLYQSANFAEEVELTSFKLTSLSATLSSRKTHNGFTYCDQSITAVMKDGSKIGFSDGGVSRAYTFGSSEVLAPDTPIILEELNYILLSDGTRLYANGRVKSAKQAASPTVSAPTELVPGETTLEEICAYYDQSGIYGCRRDFDGDGWEDLALWHSWAYRAVYLLDENGILKQEYTFDSGFDICKTHHLRREHRFYEENLLSIQDGEGCMVYQLREDGPHFAEGWKTEAGFFFQATGENSWKQISEDEYALLKGDYRSMDCHLYPIGVCWAQ